MGYEVIRSTEEPQALHRCRFSPRHRPREQSAAIAARPAMRAAANARKVRLEGSDEKKQAGDRPENEQTDVENGTDGKL